MWILILSPPLEEEDFDKIFEKCTYDCRTQVYGYIYGDSMRWEKIFVVDQYRRYIIEGQKIVHDFSKDGIKYEGHLLYEFDFSGICLYYYCSSEPKDIREHMAQSKPLTIKQAISRAKKATKQGDTAIALELYNAVLQYQPNNPVAKKGLRKLQNRLPRNQSVQTQLTNPSQDQINELINLYNSGQMVKTEQACRELLQTYPQSMILFNVLGAALKGQNKLQEAVQAYTNAIQRNPNYSEAYNNRGNALKDLKQTADAVKNYDKAIELQPDYIEAYTNRGNALRDLGLLEEALKNHDRAIELKPDYAEAYNNRGNVLRDLGKAEEAVKSLDKAIELNNYFPEAFNNKGTLLSGIGMLAEAVSCYDKAIELKPDYLEVYNNRGTALSDLGQFDEAMKSYNKAIEIQPDCADAHRNLSILKKYRTGDAQIELMESLFSDSECSESDRMNFCFALSKAYEDIGKFDQSFYYLSEGNRLRRKEVHYDIAHDIKTVSAIKQIFNKENLIFDCLHSSGFSSIQPIFIVGMPRSGTTLVEQIIASHSKVHGAGELEAMGKLMAYILLNLPGQCSDKNEIQLSPIDIERLRDGYIKTLESLHVSEKIITDKMPSNFMWIGFILSALPEAKIINLSRDPRATCWSIYKHFFSAKGHSYAYDLRDIANYYHLYIDLISFWRERFSNKIYDICYEDLTENQEEETRKLLKFCNLKWEEQCFNFHESGRVVRTSSAIQVRKKMYKGSSKAWKNFEKHLEPLTQALGY